MGLIALPVPINVPPLAAVGTDLSAGVNGFTVNDNTDEVAYEVYVHTAGDFTAIAFATGAITTTGELQFRVETVGTDGNPSGTLFHANGTGNVTLTQGTDDHKIKEVTLAGAVPLSVGDIIAIRAKRNTTQATLNGVVARMTGNSTISIMTPAFRDYNITSASAWSKTAGWMHVALKIDGAWMAPLGTMGAVVRLVTETFQSAAERGAKFNFPVGFRAIGVTAQILFSASTTYKFSLYSTPETSPVLERATPEVDTDLSSIASAERRVVVPFTSPVTVLANTDYVVALTPQAATNVGLICYETDYTYFTSSPGYKLMSRANGASAFTNPSNRIAIIGLIADQMESGGMLVHPGMSGGMRG